jgi:hypothetical protein
MHIKLCQRLARAFRPSSPVSTLFRGLKGILGYFAGDKHGRDVAWIVRFEVKSSYLSPIMNFSLCKEQQNSQKQEFFVVMV